MKTFCILGTGFLFGALFGAIVAGSFTGDFWKQMIVSKGYGEYRKAVTGEIFFYWKDQK